MAMPRETKAARKMLTIYELFKQKHGSWYDKIIKAEERTLGKGQVKAFSLERATAEQEDAIRTYMRQEGYVSLSGFIQYMKWSETTFYDILKIVSP